MKFKHYPLVEVEWEDACGRTGWKDVSFYRTQIPLLTRSVGYRIRNDATAVVLAPTPAAIIDRSNLFP